MRRSVLALLVVLLGAPAWAQQVPEIPFDSVPDALKLPPEMNLGEAAGVAVNSKGHVVRLHALEQRVGPGLRRHGVAAARIRPRRPLHPRDRQGALRVVVRPRGAHRRARQHLVHRQGVGHDRRVQPRRARADGVRPEEGSLRGGHAVGAGQAAAAAGRRHVPPADRRRVERPGRHLHQRRLRQLARGEVRQERRLGEELRRAGQRPGPAQHAAQHRRRRERATSTSPIAATCASRSSTATARTSGRSRSTCPCPPDARPPIGNPLPRRRAGRAR